MCFGSSEDDKRHSQFTKAMLAFLTTALKEMYLDHTLIIFL